MSGTKRMLEQQEAYRQQAFEILKQMKAIEFCQCGRIYRLTDKYETVYGLATKILKEKYGNSQDFKMFDKQIKKILDEALYDEKCPNCETFD